MEAPRAELILRPRDPPNSYSPGMTVDPTPDPAPLAGLRGDADRARPGEPAPAGRAVISVGSALLGVVPPGINAVISPYSVFAVLAMAAGGARGRTSEQLVAFLGGSDADEQAARVTAVDLAIAEALRRGAPEQGDPRFRDARPMAVRAANGLFVTSGAAVRRQFIEGLARGFGVGLTLLDYADPEGARRSINDWVRERTVGRISALMGPGTITRDTVLTLVTAVHLIAPWRTPFHLAGTEAPFFVRDGPAVPTRYLRAVAWYPHAAGDGWISITIAYRGGGLAMTVVLPAEGRFDEVRRALPEVLPGALGAGSGRQVPAGMVELSLPGFVLDTRLSLIDRLRAVGVTALFDPDLVDLSGIAGQPGDLVATELVHRAMISVDAQGTEAAAATALSMSATGAPADPVRITVDRSFLFVVHDTVTGAPLFLGQLIDPTPGASDPADHPAQGPIA